MFDQVYRELARKLDSIPPGFPATESGVELQLLARLFTREEATIVSAMQLTYEAAGDIAARASMDPGAAYDILNGAARKGFVRTRLDKQARTFALQPRIAGIVGIYDVVLHRTDVKASELYVQWIQESRGGSLSDFPAARRVIAVGEAIPFSLEIHPYEQASKILVAAKSWGVTDCMCRTLTKQAGQGCSYPLEVCLFTSPNEADFEDDELIRPISLDESLRILRQAADAGLVHTTANVQVHAYTAICNCCPCCCTVLRGVVEFNRPTVVAHSDFFATVDVTACSGCGDCIERCHFGALSLSDSVCVVDKFRCMGCGLCVVDCSFDAKSLIRRPEGETSPPLADDDEWMAEYARVRGISLTQEQ